jgi:nitroreductase
MEFQEVVRRRRMIRSYDPNRPVDPAVVDRLLANAMCAPSAGFSQGWAFLVLDQPDDVSRFWRATTTEKGDVRDTWLRGMMAAPLIVVPLSCKEAYLDRYAEEDKGWTDRDEQRWPAPYWDIDTGMAALLILQTAVDAGLGACFFGLPPDRIDTFRQAFHVPAVYAPIGAITVGHRTRDPGSTGSPARRPRRTAGEVVHHAHW